MPCFWPKAQSQAQNNTAHSFTVATEAPGSCQANPGSRRRRIHLDRERGGRTRRPASATTQASGAQCSCLSARALRAVGRRFGVQSGRTLDAIRASGNEPRRAPGACQDFRLTDYSGSPLRASAFSSSSLSAIQRAVLAALSEHSDCAESPAYKGCKRTS